MVTGFPITSVVLQTSRPTAFEQGGDLYRVIPSVTRDPSFCGLIQKATPIRRFRVTMGLLPFAGALP